MEMRRTAVSAILIAAIGALLLLAAGCGGDDDESAADTQAAAASTTDDLDTTEGETEAAETEAAEEPDFANAENCKEFTELGQKVSAALGGGEGADADATKKLLNEFAEEAPEEIRDDFRVIADAYSKIAEALEDANVAPGETPSAEDAAKLQEVAGQIDQAKLTEANTNITTWVTENCQSG
jgi:hypothetical protein